MMIGDIRKNWRSLALTDCAYKLIEFMVIVPLVGGLFRILFGLSGRTVLVDHDRLHFFMRPLGWICMVLLGGLSIAVVGTEQCALLGILAAGKQDKPLGVGGALKFAASRAVRVIKISVRLVAVCLLISAPFLALVGALFLLLLNQFDINFYLTEKPSIFWAAAVLISMVLGAQALVLLRFISGWFFALPIVVFEATDTRDALKTSRQRAAGHRKTIALWFALWVVLSVLGSASLTGVVGWIGRWIVPGNTDSIGLLVLWVGGLVMLWFLTNLAANLLSAITCSVMIFNAYQELGGGNLMVENQPLTGRSWSFTTVISKKLPDWI